MSKVKIITDQVKNILTMFDSTKDDDMKLLSVYWNNELNSRGLNLTQISAVELLRMMYTGKMEHPESIMRSRRKLQESDSSLRGKSYKGRKANVKKVKDQLGYLVND